MARKVIGYDEQGNKIWERDAREYDSKSFMGQIVPGLTIGDIVKAVPVVFLAGMAWMNQQNTNVQFLNTMQKISDKVEAHSEALQHLDNYMSSATGKQFQNGEPISEVKDVH